MNFFETLAPHLPPISLGICRLYSRQIGESNDPMCILFPNTCSYFYPCHLSLENTKHRRQKGVPVGIGTLRVDNTFLLAPPRIETQGQSKLCKSQKEVPINQYMGVAPFILFLGYDSCPWEPLDTVQPPAQLQYYVCAGAKAQQPHLQSTCRLKEVMCARV